MDGRNCSGARISLLNDSAEERPSWRRAPTSLAHSRTSSFTSSPLRSSPPTPQLVRSDSTDSATMQRTPSPVTPLNFAFDPHPVAQQKAVFDPAHYPAQLSFFPSAITAKDAVAVAAAYPPIAQHPASAAAFAYSPAGPNLSIASPSALFPAAQQPDAAASVAAVPPQPQQQQQQQQQQQASPPSKQPGKKNQYPCPLAKEYSCSHFFTTSGHAARHAKKHTGKKDAFCPECNKAFTRKDNMEQHRRTHQNGRNVAKSAGESSSPATASKRQKTATAAEAKRSKTLPLQAPPAILDPSLPLSPASSFGYPDASVALSALPQAAPQLYPPELLGQQPLPTGSPYPLGPYYDSMSGLDKLAMAASGEGPRQGNVPTF